jgi:putative ABC transport system permease protein
MIAPTTLLGDAFKIAFPNLAIGYALLLIPLGLLLWLRLPVVGRTLIAVVRMTVQLLAVGFFLHYVFELNNAFANAAWLLVMIAFADLSIVRGCDLRLKRFAPTVLAALIAGTAIPLVVFMAVILRRSNLLDARLAIPVGGMILGNCLRADIIGLSNFYAALRKTEKAYLHTLAQGARLGEAVWPYYRDAVRAALAPTIATISTIGLVFLPGMMTGVILGGANPLTAVKYQIAIMIAIFVGTAITVALGIRLTTRYTFTAYGTLDHSIFAQRNKQKRTATR